MKERKEESSELNRAEIVGAVSGDLIDGDQTALIEADIVTSEAIERISRPANQRFYIRHLFLPFIFLTVTLLGGLRLSGIDSSFIFLKPALLCLVFAAILLTLYFRSGLILLDGWFSEAFPMRKNIANGLIILSLFAATTQLFNSLIPEQGLPYWIISFCFFWTLWNNLFADFDTKKLLRSLGGLFGLAFVVKYLVLANLAAPADRSWLRSIIENPGQQAMTWLLDIPQFAAGTGYIQFFAVALYLLGLFLFPSNTNDPKNV